MIDAEAVDRYLMETRALIDIQKRKQNMHYRNGHFEKGNADGLVLEAMENEAARFQAWADRTFLHRMQENLRWKRANESISSLPTQEPAERESVEPDSDSR